MKKQTAMMLVALVSAFFSAAESQTVDGGIIVAGMPNNALTPEEKSDGYELLWNGKDFAGWLLANDKDNPTSPNASGNWAIVTTKGLESGDKHKSASPDSNMLEVNDHG